MMNILSILLAIFTIMQLNCENLFDCDDDSLKQDEDFLPTAVRRWTPNRYWEKLDNVGRAVMTVGECDPGGKGGEVIPDIVTLCEVENDTVMRDLTKRSLLCTAGYEYVMTSSPDVRGIDVALMYQPTSFAPVSHYSIGVTLPKGNRPTRDILYVKGWTPLGDTLHFFVVHAPSRYGGAKHSNPNRMAVAERLCWSIDSVRRADADANIVVSGDFNDYHDSPSLAEVYRHGMVNVTAEAKGKNDVGGTYYYGNEWNSIDHIVVSKNIADSVVSAYVSDPVFLLEYVERKDIVRPRRTYRGMKYRRGGCSDHLPLVVRLRLL